MSDRTKGRSLPEIDPQRYGYRDAKVPIYRALRATEITFKPMDYVTLSLRLARGHADHTAVVNEEPAHVIQARVPAEQVFEAPNADEYFYDGPVVEGPKKIRNWGCKGSANLYNPIKCQLVVFPRRRCLPSNHKLDMDTKATCRLALMDR